MGEFLLRLLVPKRPNNKQIRLGCKIKGSQGYKQLFATQPLFKLATPLGAHNGFYFAGRVKFYQYP